MTYSLNTVLSGEKKEQGILIEQEPLQNTWCLLDCRFFLMIDKHIFVWIFIEDIQSPTNSNTFHET